MTYPIEAAIYAGLSSASMFAEIFCASCLFAHGQPLRQHALRHSAAMLLLYAASMTALIYLSAASTASEEPVRVLVQDKGTADLKTALFPLGFFALALAALIPMLHAVYEMGVLACIYCATTGYALQNLASSIWELAGLTPLAAIQLAPVARSALAFAYYALAYFAAWKLYIRHIAPSGLTGHLDPTLLPMIAVVIFGIIGYDLILKNVATGALPVDTVICLRLVHILICLFVILAEVQIVAVHRLQEEKAVTERLLAERDHQYEMSRETIDAINIKCHDLRHQIRSLAQGGTAVDKAVLDDAAQEIRMYDTAVHTGNEALDTILTEKRLVAEKHGITLTCIADGTALSGMAAADLYAFFGNALDNAIRAVDELDSTAQRSISVIVKQKLGMASIHIENYCRQAQGLRFEDGLPATTKADTANHGFGTRSMRDIIERYGGTISFSATGSTFCVDALVP